MNETNALERTEEERVAAPAASILPAVDIVEDEEGITLYADLPGVPKDDLQIRVDAENLVFEGLAKVAVPERLDVVYGEVREPHYRRSFTLSRELDATRIEAALNDGVLKLRIPKAEAAKPRRIEVKLG
jgi:HSP20 family molecular chaperone IbpA